MAPSRSLLEELQDLIERTYDLERSVQDIGKFVIGDDGYRRLVEGRELIRVVHAAEPGPAVLVRQEAGGILASLYYPDWLILQLERHPPLLRVDAENLPALGLFVEELDHLLFLADRARQGRPVRLLELEFHANVTAELAARLLWARQRRRATLGEPERRWLRRHLRGDAGFGHLEAGVRARYADAARLAERYVDRLDRFPREARLPELRRFHRRTWGEHVEALGASGSY
ncbi:MAG: hypothetical protein HY509_00390 [Acidobacteria bacterium]|nr:hypothetical protein [Acidobacteriota bacterium]